MDKLDADLSLFRKAFNERILLAFYVPYLVTF
jgi:hypothetical protein